MKTKFMVYARGVTVLILMLFCLAACSSRVQTLAISPPLAAVPTPTSAPDFFSQPLPDDPGTYIDEVFPPLTHHDSSMEEDNADTSFDFKYENYLLKIKKNVPQVLLKNGKRWFEYKADRESYRTNVIGISRLLGKAKKQLYFVNVGSGAVCCTNYWIVDISSARPKEIYRTEDYGGSLGDPIELFDADGDGVYEMVQAVYAFRYMLDECGTCSPQPRAVLKYDRRAGKYLPAKDIYPPWAAKIWKEEKARVIKAFREKKFDGEGIDRGYSRTVVDLLTHFIYRGREKEAWAFFDKYYVRDGTNYNDKSKTRVRREIKYIINHCRFYQALYRK